ncbi:La ribonucleoprotein [Cymbomonas tetramitiformis]|uniref:La ribonucleoprotein n=1 Tax=Cymbomonas tetramitiformis TaxID=36881 RepID=A0AAE0BCT4_9CHLO|nr:La ribonucleoprotein [Cymbomonas tetramitiformis]
MRGRGKRPRHGQRTTEELVPKGKGAVKRTPHNHFDAASSDDTKYEVEAVLAERSSYGVAQFLIKWKGFEESSNTWEPLTNLPGHDIVVEEFRANLQREQDRLTREAAAAKSASKEGEASAGAENGDGFTDVGDQLRSIYWQHFEVLKEGKRITHYRCKHCGPDAPAKEYCGNTSNLRAHLLYAHKDVVVAAKGTELFNEQSQESATKRGRLGA